MPPLPSGSRITYRPTCVPAASCGPRTVDAPTVDDSLAGAVAASGSDVTPHRTSRWQEYIRGVSLPIRWDDVVAARARIAPHLSPTPLRHYATLDEEVGN